MSENKKKQIPASKNKPKKKELSFDFSKLTETQWAILGGVVFFIGYILYTFVLSAPATTSLQDGLNTPVQALNIETDEQKFKRENKDVSLPDGSAIPKKVIEDETKLTQQIPFGDKNLEYRIRLPKNWVMSDFAKFGLPGEETYSVLTNLARYFGPAIEDARPFVWVEAEKIKRYTTAETWARTYMIKRGISPEALQENSTTDVQALYVDVRDFRSYAVRSLFKVVGDTMVIVSYGVPLQVYKETKDMMGLTLNSFEILNPSTKQIEEIKTNRLLNIITFEYYASWSLRNLSVSSILKPSFELHNPQEVGNQKRDLLQGVILGNVFRKTSQFSEKDNLAEIANKLQKMRMQIKAPISKVKKLKDMDKYIRAIQMPYLAQVDTYVRTDQFDIIKSDESKTQNEVWITILDNDYYVAYLTMISPQKSTSYTIWAQNMSAYQLLIDSAAIREPPSTK